MFDYVKSWLKRMIAPMNSKIAKLLKCMAIPFYQALTTGLLLVAPLALADKGEVSNAAQTHIRTTLSAQKDSAIRLEARQAPLGQILKEIASKTGAHIHYSVLPEALVTATCVGANVSQIMNCLVAKQVGLVTHSPKQGKPAEFWVLGPCVGSCQALTIQPAIPQTQAATDQQHKSITEEQAQIDQTKQEQSDKLLEQAKVKDPEQRYEAITRLISEGVKDDPNVRKVLEVALADKEANVRAQAVYALARREGKGAAKELRQAMRDKDANVRLMAVNYAGNDTVLLQQALTDKDLMIHDIALSKLKALKQTQGAK